MADSLVAPLLRYIKLFSLKSGDEMQLGVFIERLRAPEVDYVGVDGEFWSR